MVKGYGGVEVYVRVHHHYWLDSPWCALAFLRSFTHSSLLRATFFKFLAPNIPVSWPILSSHRNTFHEPTLRSFSPLQCRPWQIGPVFTFSDFVTMFFYPEWRQPYPSNPGGPMFAVGVVSLSWPALTKVSGTRFAPVHVLAVTLPRGHDMDMHVWDLAGINGIYWIFSVHSCQQTMHPQGHYYPFGPRSYMYTCS
jgi:hypothetical protein